MIGGFFRLSDTYGIPLDIVIDGIVSRGHVPDWLSFREEALAAGWTEKGICARLEAVIGDVLGPEYLDEWRIRWKKNTKTP